MLDLVCCEGEKKNQVLRVPVVEQWLTESD